MVSMESQHSEALDALRKLSQLWLCNAVGAIPDRGIRKAYDDLGGRVRARMPAIYTADSYPADGEQTDCRPGSCH
jgi:hypothetical protein